MCGLTSGSYERFLTPSFGWCVELPIKVQNTEGGTGVGPLSCVCVGLGHTWNVGSEGHPDGL